MKKLTLNFIDILKENPNLTYLVGAGCSIDPPSCQPAGRRMMDAMIKHACAESELNKIMNIKELRFEALVEILRDNLDKELRIIDFYNQCEKPNLQHFYLAEMLREGQFVMTTNFDFLIEQALVQGGTPKDEIKIVITRKDFENYNNPDELCKQDKKVLYKIHGSTRNLITNEDTRDSLVATIQAFGSNKEGMSVFQVEPFKKALFDNISKDRTIIIMGYSGSDDFDVVPTLKVLNNVKAIIWLNFIFDDGDSEHIFEIEEEDQDQLENANKIDKILIDIKIMNPHQKIMRVNTNTSRLIKTLIKSNPNISEELFSLTPEQWLESEITKPNTFMKYYISHYIYYYFNFYEDALNCAEKLLELSDDKTVKKEMSKKDILSWKSLALNNIGSIFDDQGKYNEALKYYKKSQKISEKIGDLKGKSIRLNNIAYIYYKHGMYEDAMKIFKEILSVDEKANDLSSKALTLNNIGNIHLNQGDYSDALAYFQEALALTEKVGDLNGKQICLNSIGQVHEEREEFNDALKFYQDASRIDEELKNYGALGIDYNNIGKIYHEMESLDEALEMYDKAAKIFRRIGNLDGQAMVLNNIGQVYYDQDKFDESITQYERALPIYEKLKNHEGLSAVYNNVAMILDDQKKYSEAIENYEKAIALVDEINDRHSKARYLNNKGMTYYAIKDFKNALKDFKQALEIMVDLNLENTEEAELFKDNIEVVEKKIS